MEIKEVDLQEIVTINSQIPEFEKYPLSYFTERIGTKKYLAIMAINKKWHEDKRIIWHLEHQKHCSCRPIPQKLLLEMYKRSPNR